MNNVLKKYKAKSNNQTIASHNQDMFKLIDNIKHIVNINKKLYKKINKCIKYHDIGKVTDDFQNNLTSINRKCRHEILSASLKNLDIQERIAILTHHKSILEVDEHLKTDRQIKKYKEELEEMCQKLNIPLENAINIPDYILDIKKNENVLKNTELILLKGLLNLVDHLSSAGINRFDINTYFTDSFKFDNYTNIQQECKNTNEDCIIIGRTGIGKTEGSLYWADNVQNKEKSRRIFYILPFTASINAMYARLKNKDISTGMLHSKAKYFIYKELENLEEYSNIDSDSKNNIIKEKYQMFRYITKQTTICTIFQILKAFFGCKYSEMFISMFSNSIFIIDEIHCFNIKDLALLITTLKWLKNNFNINICIMSASIPTPMIKLLQKELSINKIINSTYEENLIKRHRILFQKNKCLQDDINLIRKNIKDGKKVLVCVNTIKQAQELYSSLNKYYKNNNINIKMLHGRFNTRSREKIEKEITEKNNNVQILIGTQAIEVSLDIDYDILFTELASIDALIQRFGRVNRKRVVTDIKDIYIYEATVISNKIYDEDILNRTKQVISNINIVDENKIQEYLNIVYLNIDYEKYRYYQNNYLKVLHEYKVGYIDKQYSDEMIDQNNISILCRNLLDEYINNINNKEYILANNLFVNISTYQFNKLNKNNYITYDNERNIYVCSIDYDEEIGLNVDVN